MKNDGRSYPIVTFDQLIDIDFGLLQMINNKYNNKDTFYWSLLEAPAKLKLGLLYNRKHSNPLTVIAKDFENIELLNDYYNQFIEEEYAAILKESITTRFYNAIKGFTSDNSIIVTVVCKNAMEENYFKKIDKEFSDKCVIIVDKNEYKNIVKDEKYSPVYLKNIADILSIIDCLAHRTVFIADYRFNFENDERTKFIDNLQDIIGTFASVRVYNVYDKEKDILEGV